MDISPVGPRELKLLHRSGGNMTRQQFLYSLDKLVELPRGTLKGYENLEDLEHWNSLAMISFIALADTVSRVGVTPTQLMACVTVSDLLDVAQVEPTAH